MELLNRYSLHSIQDCLAAICKNNLQYAVSANFQLRASKLPSRIKPARLPAKNLRITDIGLLHAKVMPQFAVQKGAP